MKILLGLMIAGTALFAGGDLLPVKIYEKPVMQKAQGCYKPNIQKCPGCVDVAEICPDDPNLPMAETEPCEVSLSR